jgi:FkbM family methyltransferase
MTNEKLKELFNSALTGFAQDNQKNSTNKKNLILNSIKHPLRMAKLADLLVNNRIYHKSYKEKISTFWSGEMTIIIPEEVSLKLFAYRYFEPGLTWIVLEYLNKNDTFIDIGAHFGYFSLLGSQIVGSEGKVHSFEPIPTTFDILKSNTRDRSNIKINNFALFSKSCQLSMIDLGIERSAYNAIITTDEKNTANLINVNTICLDDYVNSNTIRPNFIKLDAEGAEYEILTGAKSTLETFSPIVSLEVGGSGSEKCINYLKEMGYSAYKCRKGKIIMHSFQQKYDYDNLLFLPR